MKLYVDLKEHGYPIYIERGILAKAAEKISEVYQGKKVMIISDDQVYSYYGDKLKNILLERYVIGKTQTEIAGTLNISQAQVSRIEKCALSKVRRLIK